MDYKFKTEPYAHQLKALGASHNRENYALFMEMGTGKSKVLVDNIAMLYDKGKINAALIVAPKGVYRNWERQEIPIHMPDHIVHNVVTWSPAPPSSPKVTICVTLHSNCTGDSFTRNGFTISASCIVSPAFSNSFTPSAYAVLANDICCTMS